MDKFSVAPFLLSVAASQEPQKLNVNRIIEAVIIAAITGMVTLWGTTKVLEVKMVSLDEKMKVIETHAIENNRMVRDDLTSVRRLVETHISNGNHIR